MRGVRPGAVIAIALLLVGCSAVTAVKGLFVSGVSLEVLGEQFVSVSAQVTSGCEQQVIPRATCDRYRIYGENFKRVYPLTVNLWEAARRANDTAAQGKAEDVARVLAQQLSDLAREALGAFAPEIR